MKIGERMNITLKKNNTFSVKVDGVTVTTLATESYLSCIKSAVKLMKNHVKLYLTIGLSAANIPNLTQSLRTQMLR